MGTFIASWKLKWGFHKLPYPMARFYLSEFPGL